MRRMTKALLSSLFLLSSVPLLVPMHEYTHCIISWLLDSSTQEVCKVTYTPLGSNSNTLVHAYRWWEHPIMYIIEVGYYVFLIFLSAKWITNGERKHA